MANYTLSLIIDATNKAEGPLKNLGGLLDNLGQVGGMAAGALGELYSAGQKLYEFGKLGATVDQTSASFQRLGMDLGAMRAATNGTVDDMTLMSSTLTLAAGASEQLQAAFAGSTDDLLRIAKAASALNPTLGDTTFMYESLALGIKRGSPMILDNLGLTINIAKANEDYARSIGKSVAALTDEERKIALLNGTLAAGNRLIEQNGGNVDSATDGFNKLAAAGTNLKNTMSQAASASGGFFGKLADGVDGISKWQQALNIAMDQGLNPFQAQLAVLSEAAGASNTVFDEMRAQQEATETANQRAMLTAQAYAEAYGLQLDTTQNSLETWNQYDFAMQQVATSQQNAATAAYSLQAAQDAAALSAATAESSFLDTAAAIGEMSMAQFAAAQIEALRASLDGTPESAARFVEAQQAILIQFGLLTPAEAMAQEKIDALSASFLSGQGSGSTFAAELLRIKSGIDALQDKTVTVTYKTIGTQEGNLTNAQMNQAVEESKRAAGMQSGFNGIFTRPTLAVFGEGGPERVMAQPLNNVTNNNFNLSVNTPTAAGSVIQDFRMMRAFVGR